MAARAGIDPDAFAAWMAATGTGFEPPLSFAPIGNGKSNICLLVRDSGGRRCVARRAPHGVVLASAHDVRREALILSGLAGSAVPAPRVLGLCEAAEVCEVPVLAMEFVAGVGLGDAGAESRLGLEARGRVAASMAATLAEVHALDLEAAGLADLSSHGHYGSRQLRRWRRQWDEGERRELPVVLEIAEALEERLPDQGETVLLHGDFHQLNCLLDPDRGEVLAVLDWELSTLGDPVADLGSLLAYWSSQGGNPLGGRFAVTAQPGFSAAEDVVAAYGESCGRDLSALDFWQALAYWKLAIIVEGVNQRHRADPANAPGLGDEAVERLLRRALDLLEQGVRI